MTLVRFALHAPSSAVLRRKICLGFLAIGGAMLMTSLQSVSGLETSRDAAPSLDLVKLNGPWKFHLGDDPAWAAINFDDSSWEVVDLTPSAGAHDGDVGLTGFVPGWGARGHRGSSGYAWYRIRVPTAPWNNEAVALAGPPAVDSAYQLFVDGRLVGGCGDFSGSTPTAFSIQPRLFLPVHPGDAVARPSMTIALRVWMGPWELPDPAAGGIRIAPAAGSLTGVTELYREQWKQTIRGYIVDAVEAVIFLLLALVVARKAWRPGTRCFVIALVLTALPRANQAVFFWAQIESVHGFEMVTVVLLIPLVLAAWIMAWREQFALRGVKWIPPLVAGLTSIVIIAQFFARSWFHGIVSPAANADLHLVITWIRWLFVGLTAVVAMLGARQRSERFWFVLAALMLISIGQFASELSTVGVPGIWFPFGTGVSRTQFAYAAFDALMFGGLVMRCVPRNAAEKIE